MAQAKSRTDAERMEALERLLQEESVEDWRSLQLGAPRAAMPASDSVSSRDPRNLRDPSNARARQLVTSAVPISVACFAGRPVWYLAWTLMQRQDVGQPV
ncbi:unnamed protein product [Effrenium voratum]|nr:unnamed protein product [Effrenium voratum]